MYHELGDETIWNAAKVNMVEPIIAYRLMKILGENKIPHYWTDSYNAVHEEISAYLNELDRVSGILASHGIPLVALKNGGIARAIYRIPGCVPMGDVDTLVLHGDFKKAHEVLVENGYIITAPNKFEKADVNHGYRTGGSEYKTTLPDGRSLWFELQWRPHGGRWVRPDQEPAVEELIERSVGVPGSSVRILCPDDNLLHVATHTAKHSYVREPGIRLHLDIDRIVGCLEIDWDVFLEQVLKLKVKTPVYFSLLIPKLLFNTPIPERVLLALEPSPWKKTIITHWLNRADLFNPHEKKFSKVGYIIFTTLLYDDFRGVLRSLFPERAWMRERYKSRSEVQLLFLYLKRLVDLAFKRTNT